MCSSDLKIYFSVLCSRGIVKVESRHSEHFARALAVADGDKRSIHIDKAVFIEEFMNGECRRGAHAENRIEKVCSGAQIRYSAEVFKGVTLLLNGVVRR